MPSKQAVLLIHGIGEQRPMDTLRKFVHTVWESDTNIHHAYAPAEVFSKPDQISGSYELRRLTTTQNKKGVRTDFYEFYWAHLMSGTSFMHVLAWAKCLLLRWPWDIPRHLLGFWFLLVFIGLFVVFLVVQSVFPGSPIELSKWLTGTLGAAIAAGVMPIINNIVGDAARYLNPAPSNIQRRQEIRSKGVHLLKKLHDSGQYDRIVVVGHSLGSVIGYDVLTYAWADYNTTTDKRKPNPVLDELEEQVANRSINVVEYQEKQRKLLAEQQEDGNPWLVTDFVTLGCPLAHAEILLASNKEDLKSKQVIREFSTCPPELEGDRISYPLRNAKRTLHHAAVFGPTRWTNLYFPVTLLVHGDFIGGPISRLFGWGIVDKEVSTSQRWGMLSHTLYWKGNNLDTDPHIAALREALNLLDD